MNRKLSDQAQAVIRAGLAEEARPSAAHRARLRRSVLVRAAAGGAITLAGSSVAQASAASAFATIASSIGVGFGAGVVLLGALELARPPTARTAASHPERAVAVASVRSLDPSLVAAPASMPVSIEAPPQVLVPSARRLELPARGASSSIATSSPASGSPLRAELDLMAQVQGALRDGQGLRALQLIADYDARYAGGVLETERLAAEVFAACLVGDPARAQRAAQLFLQRDHSSALAVRVQKACPSQLRGP